MEELQRPKNFIRCFGKGKKQEAENHPILNWSPTIEWGANGETGQNPMRRFFKMKKMLILSLVMVFALGLSLSVIAEAPDPIVPGENDPEFKIGKGIFKNYEGIDNFVLEETDTGSKYTVISGARTTGSTDEIFVEQGDQKVKVIINTVANIPCYLEMELTGNAGYSHGISFGPEAEALMDRRGESHWMLFHSDFGGFLNENWESVAQDDVEAGAGLFLHACDMWEARIYGNIDHRFEVIADPLKHVEYEEEILMDMRYTFDGSPNWVENTEIGAVTVGDFGYLEENTVYMQFRIPFDDIPAGQYEGDITFKAYSI